MLAIHLISCENNISFEFTTALVKSDTVRSYYFGRRRIWSFISSQILKHSYFCGMYWLSVYYNFVPEFWWQKPVTVAVRSKAWTDFARSKAGIVGSNSTEGMDICVFVLSCVQVAAFRRLITHPRSHTACVKRIMKLKKPGPNKGCEAIDEWMNEWIIMTKKYETECFRVFYILVYGLFK
jgi:hypothetical protein